MSDQVRIVEVGPRDGLQNEKTPVSVAARIAFIEALVGAGLHTVEVGAFVSPKAIPQMVGSDQVLCGVNHRLDGEFHVLVPNEKGYEAAREAGARVIAVFASASEGFSRANINCSVAESIERFKPVVVRARADGIKVRGYISCVLGCPFDGEVKPQAVVDVAQVRIGFPCSARYQPGNPHNSIVVSEEWSGLREGLPVLPSFDDPDPLDLSHLRPDGE